MEIPSKEELIGNKFLIKFIVSVSIFVGIVILFNPTDHTPSEIEDGEFSINGEKFNIESGINPPSPEESLEYDSEGWCIYYTPDGCVKRFDNRSEAREYILEEAKEIN